MNAGIGLNKTRLDIYMAMLRIQSDERDMIEPGP